METPRAPPGQHSTIPRSSDGYYALSHRGFLDLISLETLFPIFVLPVKLLSRLCDWFRINPLVSDLPRPVTLLFGPLGTVVIRLIRDVYSITKSPSPGITNLMSSSSGSINFSRRALIAWQVILSFWSESKLQSK
jgi:hypothetical protein